MSTTTQEMWARTQAELVTEFGEETKKLALAEVLGLRKLAIQAQTALNIINNRANNNHNKPFTR